MRRALALTTILCAACAGLLTPPPEYFQGLDDDDLCASYSTTLTIEAKRNAGAEIERRGLVTEDELSLAMTERIRIGMSKCALLASWGRPTKIHRSNFSDNMWIYRHGAAGSQYVWIGYKTDRPCLERAVRLQWEQGIEVDMVRLAKKCVREIVTNWSD